MGLYDNISEDEKLLNWEKHKTRLELINIVNEYELRSGFRRYFLDVINPFDSSLYNYRMARKALKRASYQSRGSTAIVIDNG